MPRNLGIITSALALLAGCGSQTRDDSSIAAGGKAERAEERPSPPTLLFEDADLQCFDGSVEIGIYMQHVQESDLYMQQVELGTGNVIKINVGGQQHVIDQSVFVVTDGAGNDTAQVFYVTSYGLKPVIDVHYDHEVGFMRGFYSLPKYRLVQTAAGERVMIEGFGERVDLSDAMSCYN